MYHGLRPEGSTLLALLLSPFLHIPVAAFIISRILYVPSLLGTLLAFLLALIPATCFLPIAQPSIRSKMSPAIDTSLRQ